MEPQSPVPHQITHEAISNANSPDLLMQVRMDFHSRLLDMRSSVSVGHWLEMVNEMHDMIACRAVQICEQGMVEEGFGLPPVPYAFIAFGSVGRCESTLWSDQDNGMIISDEVADHKEAYFERFGKKLSRMLEQLGYKKCEGKVMCSEPLWRRTLPEWQGQLEQWSQDFSWEPVRYLIIASDMRHIAGDGRLSAEWKRAFQQILGSVPELPSAVLRNTVRHKATLNILGQVVTERFGEHAGDFDVKYGLYIPLVNAVRYMALQYGVTATSTIGRLKKLGSLEAAPHPLLDSCNRAFQTALHLRIATPVKDANGLPASSGFVPLKQLKQQAQWYELRESLAIVRRVHRALQRQLRFMERRRV